MDDRRLERIEKKIDDSNEHLASIDLTLAAQHESLKQHMLRTTQIEKELRPIRRHVYMVQGGLALLTILATIAGIVSAFRR